MIHRHLDYEPDTPVAERGRAALDDLLDRGDLEEWAPLARAVAADPGGRLASAVLEICAAHPMYGTSLLWESWIQGLRRHGASFDDGRTVPLTAGPNFGTALEPTTTADRRWRCPFRHARGHAASEW